MAPHSSTLAWKNPWMEKPGRLQSMGSLRVGHDWATSLSLFTFMHWRRKWQPTPVCSCLENPRDGGAWWAAIYGVTQSQRRLKRLSSPREPRIVLNPSNSWSGLHMLFLKSPWTLEKLEHFPWLPASASRWGLFSQRLCLWSAHGLTFPVTRAYFPGGSERKESACNARDLVSIPPLGRSPGKANGYPLQ